MKKATDFISAALVGVILTLMAYGIYWITTGNSTDTRSTTRYVVFIDETDSTHFAPDTAALIADLGIETDMWNGVDFSLSRLVDVSYTRRTRLVLPEGGSRLASSIYTRKKEVAAFKAQLAALMDSVSHDSTGKPYSSIYLPLAEETARLAEDHTAKRKVLVVVSDLREHMPSGVSFYDPHTVALLSSDPEKVEAQFLAIAPLPDLTGVEIKFSYIPKNAKDDASYRLASGFWRRMFEAHGANVTVAADMIQ